jgi:hypothetical protein
MDRWERSTGSCPAGRFSTEGIVGSEAVAARMMMTGGLRLRVSRSDGWVIFWTTRSVDDLLARLARAGVPVGSTHQCVSFWTTRDL